MFCKVMMYQGTNLCVSASINIDTKYIFQFLTIFAYNLIILPQKYQIKNLFSMKT